jgi:hypothetical protein
MKTVLDNTFEIEKVEKMFNEILKTKICYKDVADVLYENGFEYMDEGTYLYNDESGVYLWLHTNKSDNTIEFEIEKRSKTIQIGKCVFSEIEKIKKYLEYLFALKEYEIKKII